MNFLERSSQIVKDRSNGTLDGISSGKGGRAWLDGEWQLVELEALCVLIREKCYEDGVIPDGLTETLINDGWGDA